MALYGLDLSHYQSTDTVDQAQNFVILKATEGTSFVDPDCDNKYQRAKSQGKLLGVFGYADMTDATAEANYFVDNIQGYIGEALLALDNETQTNVSWALMWLNQVYARTQVRAQIYMSASTTRAVDWSPVVNAGYALWVAGYPSQFNVANPGIPAPDGSDMPYATGAWPFATIWQYSSSAGTLDHDIAYMSREAWAKFAIGDRNVPTPVPTSTPDPVQPTQSTVTPDPAQTTPVTATDAPVPGDGTTPTSTTEQPTKINPVPQQETPTPQTATLPSAPDPGTVITPTTPTPSTSTQVNAGTTPTAISKVITTTEKTMYTTVDKAIAAGTLTTVIAWLAHYGITLNPLVHDTIASLLLAAVTYLVAHIAVYFIPNTKK